MLEIQTAPRRPDERHSGSRCEGKVIHVHARAWRLCCLNHSATYVRGHRVEAARRACEGGRRPRIQPRRESRRRLNACANERLFAQISQEFMKCIKGPSGVHDCMHWEVITWLRYVDKRYIGKHD